MPLEATDSSSSAMDTPTPSNLSPKTPVWTTGPTAKPKKATPRTVRGEHKLKAWDTAAVGAADTAQQNAGSSQPDEETELANTVVRGDAYHYGLCTLHIKRLPQNLVTESTLACNLTERLMQSGKTGDVVQVTTRDMGPPHNGAPNKSWALVTFSNVMSANKILSRNASHVDGLGLQMQLIDIVAAAQDADVKDAYQESKSKAAAEMERLNTESREKARRRKAATKAAGGMAGAGEAGTNSIGYSYESCTLHVRKIPPMKKLRAKCKYMRQLLVVSKPFLTDLLVVKRALF